ncbi:MAG: GNAT family N-acetyltransferase [Thermoplasmata archaeon]
MKDRPTVRLRVARGRESVTLAARMFREYADGLGFPLDFQDFHHEVSNLPGEYAPPRGALTLAFVGSRLAGCVGLRPIDQETSEMKRLFVRNEFRGQGIGRCLVDRVIADARRIGYQRMRLDTVPDMAEAIRLYHQSGFVQISPYRFNPIPGALYFELDLRHVPGLQDSVVAAAKSMPATSRSRRAVSGSNPSSSPSRRNRES